MFKHDECYKLPRTLHNFSEISVKKLWNKVKNINEVKAYMPDFRDTYLPNKAYLF